ncbi:MAG: hypothetical protein AAGB19_00455 [Cyanobacteria bacterium P01_F01_bin.3]
MSGEFYDLDPVTPKGTDELLVIRDRTGKRATIQSLQTAITANAISYGGAPPSAGLYWGQTTAEGALLALWLKRGELWVSQQTWQVQAIAVQLNGNRLYTEPNPCPGERIWLDSMMARGVARDNYGHTKWQFKLNTVSAAQQELPQHYLEVAGIAKNQAFNHSEPIGEVLPWSDALTIWLRAQRSGGSAKNKFVSMAAVLRRVYSAESNGGA